MTVPLRGLAAMFILTLLVAPAGANAGRPPFPPPPPPPPGPAIKEDLGKVLSHHKAAYVTVFDANAKRTRLVIPQKYLAVAKGAAKDAPRTSSIGGHGLMAGMALSLGLVTGGLWWARRGTGGLGKGKLTLLLMLGALGVCAVTASALFADLAPFPRDKAKGPQPGPGLFGGNKMDVDVDVTEKGDAIYLVLPGNLFGGPPGGVGPGGGFGGGFGGGPGVQGSPPGLPVPPPTKAPPGKQEE